MKGRCFPGLDVWRAGLLTAGLFYHGTMFHDDNLAFDLIQVASGAFRMAAFFAIAGFLAARSLSTRPADTWIIARSVKLGLPAVLGVLIISPTVWAMMTLSLPAEKTANILLFDWHHLWFLFALLFYQVIAYTLSVRVAPRSLVSGIIRLRRMGQVRVLLALTLLSAILTLVALSVVLLLAPAAWQPMLLQVRLIAAYAPLYLFGMALGVSPSLRKSLLRDTGFPTMIVASIACGYLAWTLGLKPWLPTEVAANREIVIRLLIGALCPPAAVILVLKSALTIRRAPPWIARLCAASFTIYLVHYPLLAGTNLAATRFNAPPVLEYGAAVLLVGCLSYALHYLLVCRSTTAAFLLNGRSPKIMMSRVGTPQHLSA